MKVHGSVNALNEVNAARRANEGAISYAISDSDYIVATNAQRWHFVTSNSDVYRVCLPSADSLSSGWQITFIVSISSSFPLIIADTSSNILFNIDPGRAATVVLSDNTTSNGTWKIINQDPNNQTIRNVVLNAATQELIVNEDNQARLLPFVSNIADGFIVGPSGELTGIPSDHLVYFNPQTPYYLTAPLSFPSTTYVYQTSTNTIYESANLQDGGTAFPENPTEGYTFYNKSLGCNYVYLSGNWERRPSVVIGKVEWESATSFTCETYPFNYWIWDAIDFNEAFPSQTGNASKVFSTDGSNLYWANTHILIDRVSDTPPESPTVGTVYYDINDKKLYTYLSTGTWGDPVDPIENRIYVATSTNSFYAWVMGDMLTVGTGGVTASITYWEDVDVYQVSNGANLAYTRTGGATGAFVEAGISLYADANLNIFLEVAAANTWVYTGIVS